MTIALAPVAMDDARFGAESRRPCSEAVSASGARVTSATVVPKFTRRQRLAAEELLWRQVTRDPLAFLGVAKTLNEHPAEGEDAVQPFPICARCAADPRTNDDIVLSGTPPAEIARCRAHGIRHKPYFAPLVRDWQMHEIILDEKSRQLMISWLYLELFLWDALRRGGCKFAFQSQNLVKSCELVERAALTYRMLPKELQRFGPLSDVPRATARYTQGHLEFRHPGGISSRIFAIPCGGNQTRSFTFTGILQDECQLWEPDEEFEESYAAAIPTIKGGGKLVAVSSVGSEGSFHYRLIRGLV